MHKVRPMFEQRVLPTTEDIIVKWRLLVEDGRATGHTFSQPDLFIAATARHHGLTIVSRDTAEYRKAGATVFNPWRKRSRWPSSLYCVSVRCRTEQTYGLDYSPRVTIEKGVYSDDPEKH